MNLYEIATIADNAATSELNASLPSNPNTYRPLCTVDTVGTEAIARAKSILESSVTLEQLAAWAAQKHSDTGYGQGDFPVGDTAFQSVCISLRPNYNP